MNNVVKCKNIPAMTAAQLDSINALAGNLILKKVQNKPVLFTTAGMEENAALTALRLAQRLSAMGHPAVLVDGGLNQSNFAEYMQLEGISGLKQCLQEKVTVEEAVCQLENTTLSVLAAGEEDCDSVALLSSPVLKKLMDELCRKYEYVLVFAPAADKQIEAAMLADACPCALLSIGSEKTKRADAQIALKRLCASGCEVLGAVFTGVDSFRAKYIERFKR